MLGEESFMDSLEKIRIEINETDREIAKLFCRRMNAVKEVALYKQKHGLKVFDAEREALLIEKNSQYIEDVELKSYYVNFIKSTMDISKQYQHRLLDGMKIAYSGVAGAFAHIAAMKIFPNGNAVAYNDFSSAYKSVESGECDCCVLPIENSYAGEVGQVNDLTFDGSLYINGVYDLKVCHNLLGVKGAKISDIKKVISHPQALSQCQGYIHKNNFETISEKNTAVAAQIVAQTNCKEIAAIASDETAKIYDLEIIDHDINESSSNTTRFAVFSRVENKVESDTGKFIMLFTVKNVAGSLAKAINIIGKYGFNMASLRSRPVKEKSWQYYFFVEAEGNVFGEKGKAMLSEMSKECEKVKIAGSFMNEEKLNN